VSEIIFKIG